MIYGARYSAFTFVQGTVIALVAGWAGALSDRFGRRRCAALPAIGQAAGSAVLPLTAYYELDWRVGLAIAAVRGDKRTHSPSARASKHWCDSFGRAKVLCEIREA